MTPRTLFQIIIKIIGLFFVLELINSIPQLTSTIWYYVSPDGIGFELWLVVLGLLLGLGLYVFLAYIFLFNSNVVVDKLKLDQWFEDDVFSFRIPRTFVLMTAIVVIAGIILLQEVPNIVFNIYRYTEVSAAAFGQQDLEHSSLILSIVKVVLALLMVGERKFLLRLIDKDVDSGTEVED